MITSWLILWLSNKRGPWSCTAPLWGTFPCRLVLLGLYFFLSDTRTASIKSLISFRESSCHRAMRIKFLCYTLELGPIGIVDLKQMCMMFVYASELDQLIDQYTGNFKHQTSKCLSRIHRHIDFIHFLLLFATCKQPRSKLICVLTEISYIWRGNLDLNKAILKQNRKRCRKKLFEVKSWIDASFWQKPCSILRNLVSNVQVVPEE